MRRVNHTGGDLVQWKPGDPPWVGELFLCRNCREQWALSAIDVKKVRGDPTKGYEVGCRQCHTTNFLEISQELIAQRSIRNAAH